MNIIPHLNTNPCRMLTSLCLALIVSLSLSGLVAAKDSSDRKFSRKIGKATLVAMELMNEQKYELAADEIASLLEKKKLSPYERSTLSQMHGQTYYELGQNTLAIDAFEAAIDEGGLLPSDVTSLRQNIAKLHIVDRNYVRGAEILEQWERDGNVLTRANLEVLTNAWIMAENYERALPWAEQWFETTQRKQRKHYDLLNFLYGTLEQSEKRKNLLLVMAEKWPDDQGIQRALDPTNVNSSRLSNGMVPSVFDDKAERYGSFKITVSDRDAQPIVRIPPIMPETALTSGHCDVRFNVTVDGKPIDVNITYCTDKVFETAAIEAVRKWKYQPKIRDAKAMPRTGVETRIKFLNKDVSE